MTVYIGEIETFPHVRADKAQALKVLEESAEVYAAWQEYNGNEWNERLRANLLNESADVIQAVANLVSACGVKNFNLYVEACEQRNRERGRYGE